MAQLNTEVLVIGGGATGTGVARDLAMRGFKTILVEKGDLTHGTTGRYHGLLHSGGRYVVKDPQAARECIEENRILRQIMPQCIEDTGGFFVLTHWDDPEYAPRFISGCQSAGIPVEEITITQMLKEEPGLDPTITRCFRVPDAAADSFLAAELNSKSAKEYGSEILNYHKVIELIKEKETVIGARCHDLKNDETIEILADLVVNASGAWAGKIAAMVGLQVHIIPGKGTMLALNHRIVHTIINRCKMPSDGDILVPIHTVTVIGTTDVQVNDPDSFSIDPWEVQLMLDEGEKIVPRFKDFRILRAWAGVRPLYQETAVKDTRDVTRSFILLDHLKRDGISGFITITGGKWTTYRKMAEVTVNLVCEKLGVSRECRTHLELLPGKEHKSRLAPKPPRPYLGERLQRIEEDRSYGKLICECELATEEDVISAIEEGGAKTLDDIRRDVRLGMGPCQGGFCTYRVAGILHNRRKTPVEETNLALRDFLQERWKGLLPILWGQQLRQERLDELIYLSIFNADHLPGSRSGLLSPELYAPSFGTSSSGSTSNVHVEIIAEESRPSRDQAPYDRNPTIQSDILIIGAGLAGLTAAWQAAQRGSRVKLISKGWGALYWHTGCIDVLGYEPADQDRLVQQPRVSIHSLIHTQSTHPYAIAGAEALDHSLRALIDLGRSAGYPFHGSLDQNWLLPSALGTIRPTCLVPETMIAGDLRKKDPILVVGFEAYPDFYPELIADNLAAQGQPAAGLSLSIPMLESRKFSNSRVLAELFEDHEFCDEVIRQIKHRASSLSSQAPLRVAFPAVLGLNQPLKVKTYLESELGIPVFEIPTLPPSIPGIRLSQILRAAIEKAGGRIFVGMQALKAVMNHGSIVEIQTEAAARTKAHRASCFVLATGGILGGGLLADEQGYLSEVLLNLPITQPSDRMEWLDRQFLTPKGHPIFSSGVAANTKFQPVGADGKPIVDNLYAIGNLLAGADTIKERSFDGVALVTGFHLAKNIVER